jgi:arylsulfatase A-like enzyme
MQWPGRIPKGTVSGNPVIALDLLPTFVAAAAGAPAVDWNLDGVNLLPFLSGKDKGVPHSQLYWRFGQQWAMRDGDWKLLSMGGAPALYHLKTDIGETRDLSHTESARTEKMGAAWEDWNKRNLPALWTPRQNPAQKKKKKRRPA